MTGPASPAATDELLRWASEQEEWQRDALRRLVQLDEAPDRVASDLIKELLVEWGPSDACGTFEPLDTSVDVASDGGGAVALKSVGNLRGVNAIDETQVLRFGEAGLTLVYGMNGTGKSGYGRVLRSVCRSRAPRTVVKPDLRADSPGGGPAEGEIIYSVDFEEQPAFNWVDQGQQCPSLGRVSVFDADCVKPHVDNKQTVAFTPWAFEVLERLADVLRAVKTHMEEHADDLSRQRPAFLSAPEASGETAVAGLLRTEGGIDLDGLRALLPVSEADRRRLSDLRRILAGGADLLTGLRLQRNLLRRLTGIMGSAEDALSDDAAAEARLAHEDLDEKLAARRQVGRDDFADEPLGGIGSSPWMQLWRAACEFIKSQGESHLSRRLAGGGRSALPPLPATRK